MNTVENPDRAISLPTGGGALHGIGETFSPDLHTGTGNFTIPIELPPGRSGFQPELKLVYSTGHGNGPFGMGWGLGIPGVGGFAGFYSKDSIIESAYASAASGHSAIGLFAFFVGIIAAGLTAYYSWRLVFMTFHNKPVWKEEGDAHHADDHASHAQLETHSEPVGDHQTTIALSDIAAFAIPGLAFDRAGGRVGWGRGYYDATLAAAPQALRIGLAFECQIVESVPHDPHDVRLHYVVTEAAVYRAPD